MSQQNESEYRELNAYWQEHDGQIEPHCVVLDPDGTLWANNGETRLETRGETTELKGWKHSGTATVYYTDGGATVCIPSAELERVGLQV